MRADRRLRLGCLGRHCGRLRGGGCVGRFGRLGRVGGRRRLVRRRGECNGEVGVGHHVRLPLRSRTVVPLTSMAWSASHWSPSTRPAAMFSPSMRTLSPGPPSRVSVPGAADEHVVAGAAAHGVVAVAADEDVVAVVTVEREQRRAAATPEASTTSSPARADDGHAVVARARRRRRSARRRGRRPGRAAPLPATTTTSWPLVPLTMMLSARRRRRRCRPGRRGRVAIAVRSVPVRSLTVNVSAPARALRSMLLDVVGVHRDVADVAGEAHSLAVGGHIEVLAAALPLNSIVSVPSWPSTTSLPSPGSHWNVSSPAPSSAEVVALLSVDEVVARRHRAAGRCRCCRAACRCRRRRRR